jgi:hypothetical protein
MRSGHLADAASSGLYATSIDAPDAAALAYFYAALLGMEVGYEAPRARSSPVVARALMFQQISEYNPPRWPDPPYPQQAHLTSWWTTWTRARRAPSS